MSSPVGPNWRKNKLKRERRAKRDAEAIVQAADTRTVGGILEIADKATEPRQMTKLEALDFLERLCCELECRIESLKEEMR